MTGPSVRPSAPPAVRRLTRRAFLGTAAGALPGAFLAGCAAGLMSARGSLDGTTLAVDRTAAGDLDRPGGVLKVWAPDLAAPIVVRRTAGGELVALSVVCTHRGCHVRPLPGSFECPCHGSRYDETGSVVEGPATRPLTRYAVRETESSILIEVTS